MMELKKRLAIFDVELLSASKWRRTRKTRTSRASPNLWQRETSEEKCDCDDFRSGHESVRSKSGRISCLYIEPRARLDFHGHGERRLASSMLRTPPHSFPP